jgi:hypothetical protein
MKYELIIYDVWGNKTDGYEVNNAFTTGDHIEINDSDSDEDIIRGLKRMGLIKANCRFSSFEIDGENGYSLYVNYSPDSYPVCELRAVNDN